MDPSKTCLSTGPKPCGSGRHAPHLLGSEIASVARQTHRRGATHALTELALAAKLRCPLATFDQALARAATDHLARLG